MLVHQQISARVEERRGKSRYLRWFEKDCVQLSTAAAAAAAATPSLLPPIDLDRRPLNWKRVLYETPEAPLHGKKQLKFPVYDVSVGDYGATSFRYYLDTDCVPLPRNHVREKLFQLALVHLLGWPDKGREDLLVDAMYTDAMLAFECDEEQHVNPSHPLNLLHPDYQRPRDVRINTELTQLGYYVVRVMAFDISGGGGGKEKYRALSAAEMYQRTRNAITYVLEQRKANYAHGDFAGKVLVYPPDFASVHEYYQTERINRDAQKSPWAPEPLHARGALLEQEMAMKRARADLEYQRALRQNKTTPPVVAPAGLPVTRAAGSSFVPPASAAAKLSCTSMRSYRQKWTEILFNGTYSIERRYQERVQQTLRDLSLVATRLSTTTTQSSQKQQQQQLSSVIVW